MALLESAFPPLVPFGGRTLTGGETGTDVALLQIIYNEMLRVMNPPQGPMGQPIPVTGAYEAQTVQAVRNVQSYFGIPADGVAGTDTYFLFGQGVGANVTYGGPSYGSRPLAPGDTGGDVTVLQNRLNLFRYSLWLGGPADGVYGPRTADAVTQFQQDANTNGDTGVPTNGEAGAETLDASHLYTYAGGRGLFLGRNGFDVVFVQRLLQGLGVYGGRIHGYYDNDTERAVLAFQMTHGLTGDGIVGPATFYALGQQNRVNAPLPLPVPPIPVPVPTPSPTPTPTPTPEPPQSPEPSPVSPPVAPVPAPLPAPVPLPPAPQSALGGNCCLTLEPTMAASTQTLGGVFFIHNGPEVGSGAMAAQVIAAATLPAPSVYGPQFTGYGIVVNGAAAAAMAACAEPFPGLWTYASACTDCGPINSAQVTIAPLAADGSSGPAVLTGAGACPVSPGGEGGGASPARVRWGDVND